jgi:hypothetical protein
MADQIESKTAIMLDQAQVDAAEAAADAQENGEHIGRRPSSSGRDSKRYRKSLSFVCLLSYFLPLSVSALPLHGRTRLPAETTVCASFTTQPTFHHDEHLSLFLPSCCATSSDAIHSSPTQHNT